MDSLLVSLGGDESPTAVSYVSYLTSLSQAQLKAQSAILQSEQQSVNASLTALALRESQSFSASTLGVLDPLPDIDLTLVNLQEKIPVIDQAATFQIAKLQAIAASRKDAALLNRNERRLQDLLDMPGLIRTCVMSGYYSEATDLSLHLSRVQARHPTSILLKRLLEETSEYMQRMALQLLSLLNTPLKLAMALKVVGFLRRTGSFEENELRFLFLKGRYDNLIDTWHGLENLRPEPEKYVKKYVEVFREQVFAIITQYTSIFATTSDATEIEDDGDAFRHNLLPYFSQRVILNLTSTIKSQITLITSQTTKNTLLTQLLYTSQSMARVGCEFIGLVLEVFGDEKEWADIVKSQRSMARKLDT